ncbi:hypothetical protein [Bradyrhizobium betae]|uniref:DUF2783 domain-containing protein n=1 Tax=Bradyrhizobium betae TaxID=244734 RepID=A0A4Q1VNE7_9BRAD|nr:hypothetical protein [Bradyrhizobium betae]RXT54215.1 hypothetical protein B5V03_01850 [Bradyrhizobium betae]
MSVWSRDERERAYTNLCDAVTAAGEDKESLFLARLCLLLMEELGDAEKFEAILAQAQLQSGKGLSRSASE